MTKSPRKLEKKSVELCNAIKFTTFGFHKERDFCDHNVLNILQAKSLITAWFLNL